MDTNMKENNTNELSVEEMEQVSGGILPLVLAYAQSHWADSCFTCTKSNGGVPVQFTPPLIRNPAAWSRINRRESVQYTA